MDNSDFPIIKDNLWTLCFCDSEPSKKIQNILKRYSLLEIDECL